MDTLNIRPGTKVKLIQSHGSHHHYGMLGTTIDFRGLNYKDIFVIYEGCTCDRPFEDSFCALYLLETIGNWLVLIDEKKQNRWELIGQYE